MEEGVDTTRKTKAIDLGNGIFKLLPTKNYDPEDEIWEFLPGSIVRCERRSNQGHPDIFLAVEKLSGPKLF
ncbi:MAG: hypothetical protein AB7E52_09075 [Bdellovibrionales bacterium]